MRVIWTDLAFESFEDETFFILMKWNLDEVEKFSILVFDFIEILKTEIVQSRTTYCLQHIFMLFPNKPHFTIK